MLFAKICKLTDRLCGLFYSDKRLNIQKKRGEIMYIIVSVIAGFALGTAIFAVQDVTKLKRRVEKLEEKS